MLDWNHNGFIITIGDIMFRRILFIGLICLFAGSLFISCKPDEIEIELYSSDIIEAMQNGVCEIPIVITYELMGDYSDEIQRATEITKRYLNEDTEFTTVPGSYGSNFIIRTSIPIGKSEDISEYLSVNRTPLAIYLDSGVAVFTKTPYYDSLNSELKAMNYMVEFELPAKKTILKFVGDSAQNIAVSTIAAFIDKKPELLSTKEITRRKTVVVEFYGSEESVYSQISPQFSVEIK